MVFKVETVQHGVLKVHVVNSVAFVKVLKQMMSDGIKPIRWEMVA